MLETVETVLVCVCVGGGGGGGGSAALVWRCFVY